jgi:hypothetical protein
MLVVIWLYLPKSSIVKVSVKFVPQMVAYDSLDGEGSLCSTECECWPINSSHVQGEISKQ